MIAGLEDISEGELRIAGEVVNDKPPRERDIAMVFQNYALYPHMTVRENMAFPLRLAKVDPQEIEKRVMDAAKVLDLTEHLDRKPANLSGGQRQRVAMGRAIVRQPKAFLMDEPLSNLDAQLRIAMRTEVSRLQRRLQTTMVYVTHDQVEAMTLGDRVTVMRKGLIQQVNTPANLYARPVNLFVAGFIGSPAMNFSAVDWDGGRLHSVFGDIDPPPSLAERLKDAAPKLITAETVRAMKPGAVIVDIAIDQGGCSETSRPTTHSAPTYLVDEVVHYCVTNMPGAVARTSTFALNNVTLPFVLMLAQEGARRALGRDPHLRNGLNVYDGMVTHRAVAEADGILTTKSVAFRLPKRFRLMPLLLLLLL